MNINDNTFFDYIDGILSAEEIREFEKYLQDNPNAKKKLDEIKKSELALKNIVVDDNIIQDIPQELLQKANELGKKIDNYEKNKKTKGSFLGSIFKPLLEIPIQTKGAVAVFGVALFYLGGANIIPMQTSNSTQDFLLNISNINKQNFLPTSQYGDTETIKIDDNSFTIKDVTMSLKTRGAAPVQDVAMYCEEELDTKTIEVALDKNPNDKKTYTYCGSEESNTWELLKIEIPKDYQPIEIKGNYKITFDNQSIFLFPNN